MIRRPPRSTRTDTLFPYTTLFRSLEDATAIFDGALAILAALPAEFGREVVVRHRQAPESRESSARAADFRHSHSTCLAPASGYLSKKRCADRDLRSVERRCLYLVSLLFLPPHLQRSTMGAIGSAA